MLLQTIFHPTRRIWRTYFYDYDISVCFYFADEHSVDYCDKVLFKVISKKYS